MIAAKQLWVRLSRWSHWRVWQGRLVVWCAAAIAALTIVVFARSVDLAISLFTTWQRSHPLLPFVWTSLGGMLLAYLTRRFFQGSEGSGIPQVIAALKLNENAPGMQRLVSLRIALGKVLLGTLALLFGFSSGREGPSVQVGASLMYEFRRWLPRRFPVHPHHLILAGGAAGIAAAFNTPLAGIVFAIEELGRKFEERTNGVLLTAIILAGAIAISLQGNYTYFGRLQVGTVGVNVWFPILLVAVLGGLLGGGFSRLMLLGSGPWPGRVGRWKADHPILFAGLCGLIVAVLGYLTSGAAHGSGYLATRAALEGDAPLPFHYALAKMAATLCSYLAGIPGGIFAPCLAIGAGMGQDLSMLGLPNVSHAAWMALGMAAFLAGVTQAPITSFVIVMEMIDGHEMVVSLIAVAFLSSLLSKLLSRPVYHVLAQRFTQRVSQMNRPDSSSHAAAVTDASSNLSPPSS